MTPEEAGIIRDIFDRIRHMGPAPRDPEARAAVEHELRANPDALIGLVRAIVALDRERAALIEENEAMRAALEGHGQPSSGGGLFGDAPGYGPAGYGQPGSAAGHPGGWSPGPAPQQREPWGSAPWGRSRPAPEPMPPAPGPGGPWGGGPQGGGVMRTALGAAAGLAGGMFAYDAVKGMLGGSNQDGKSGTAQAAESGGQASGTDDFVTGGGTEDSGSLFDLFGDADDL